MCDVERGPSCDVGGGGDGRSLKAMMAAEWAEGSEEKANRVALGHSIVTRRQEVAMSKRVSLKVSARQQP